MLICLPVDKASTNLASCRPVFALIPGYYVYCPRYQLLRIRRKFFIALNCLSGYETDRWQCVCCIKKKASLCNSKIINYWQVLIEIQN